MLKNLTLFSEFSGFVHGSKIKRWEGGDIRAQAVGDTVYLERQ